MKKRADIDEKYKWDIGLFKTQKEIENVFTTMQFLTDEMPKFYGKFNDKDKFFEYLTTYEKQEQLIQQFCFYLSNTYATDNSNVEILKLM